MASLARQFMTSEGIAHRILVVWVHSFMRYFNCCPFPLNMLNCRYPFGDQLTFMSRNVICFSPFETCPIEQGGGGGSIKSSIFRT